MNMFKPVSATTRTEYIDQLEPERKELISFLDNFIQEAAPSLKPHFANNMLGYGSFPCTDYKKRQIEWPVVALASQKNYVSVYLCAVIDGEYIAEQHAEELGNVNVGKSCIRFKKLEQVDLPTLKKCLQLAAKHPGLVGAGEHKKK